jgi:hypothetical protein
MPLDRFLAAAERDLGRALAQLGDEPLHTPAAALVLLTRLDVRLENGHALSLTDVGRARFMSFIYRGLTD